MFSCNRSPNNELDQTDTLEFYNIPDKYKNNSKIIQLVQDFNRDKTITNKYGSNLYLTESKTSTIVLSGVRNKHVWFKIYDVDNWLTITEYLSPDTVIDSYTWDLPYGEKRSVLFGDYLKVFIDKYFQIDESEIVKNSASIIASTFIDIGIIVIISGMLVGFSFINPILATTISLSSILFLLLFFYFKTITKANYIIENYENL